MEILDLVFRGGGDVQVKVICMVEAIVERFTVCMVGAIVGVVTQGNKTLNPQNLTSFSLDLCGTRA
jgi:hypothetical protein